MSHLASVAVDVSAVLEDLRALQVQFPVDALVTIQAHRELFIPHLFKRLKTGVISGRAASQSPRGRPRFLLCSC